MRAWQDFERLTRRARADAPPEVDVTHRVLHQLEHEAPPAGRVPLGQGVRDVLSTPTPTWPPGNVALACAGVAVAAASIVAILALHSWADHEDPLADLFQAVTLVM